ncbi:C2H2 type zinc finger containing protein [Colletotrichum tofieldiae]|nr:C2H2 type zinc finger containing protein [Colletotrichum tofieldiae]GKT75160.1 C2H2 type zinc finger containing protein [Colletotrichum tofieldiae]GKT92400.1 C2H2 type zinc finger containing protein [Colletotrichum tofieldiae]
MARPFAEGPKASGDFFAEGDAPYAAANKEHEETTLDAHYGLTAEGHDSEGASGQFPLPLLAASEDTDLSLVDDDWVLPSGYLDDIDISNELHTATQPEADCEFWR